MKRAILLFALGACRSSDAEPPPVRPEPTIAASRAAPPRPALPSRKPARGLASDLLANDPKVRRAAVAEAAADPQVMLTASRDADADVARTAIASLTKLYADGQVEPKEMVALAADRTIPDRVRILAINGAGTIASPEAAAMLVTMLGGSELERRSASALLGHQDPELAVPALIGALADPDEYVPRQAADSLKLLSRGRDFGLDAGAWQAWWQARR